MGEWVSSPSGLFIAGGGEETSVPVIKEMRGPQSQSWSGGQ